MAVPAGRPAGEGDGDVLKASTNVPLGTFKRVEWGKLLYVVGHV